MRLEHLLSGEGIPELGVLMAFDGGLAQLARAPVLQAGGQRFESVILHDQRTLTRLEADTDFGREMYRERRVETQRVSQKRANQRRTNVGLQSAL